MDQATQDDTTVAIPVSLLRRLEANWERGDLAGTVDELTGYIPEIAAATDAPVRFTCPIDPNHDAFYLRRTYSEAYNVTPSGIVASEETRNSYEGEGSGPVMCSTCWDLNSALVEAIDATPGEALEEEHA